MRTRRSSTSYRSHWFMEIRGSGAIQPEGDIRYLFIFGAVAFFILLMAAINYTNLATARSMQRAKRSA